MKKPRLPHRPMTNRGDVQNSDALTARAGLRRSRISLPVQSKLGSTHVPRLVIDDISKLEQPLETGSR